MTLDVGKMRHRLIIERPSEVQGPSGQPIDAWVLFAERWAQVEAFHGLESDAPQQLVARVHTIWRVRFLAGVDPTMRVRHGDKVYDILAAVDPNGLRVELVLTCFERVLEPA